MNIKQLKIPPAKDIVENIVGACLLFSTVYVTDILLKLQPTVLEFFRFPDSSPGGFPPWYFIREHFADGICALGAFLISLAIAAIGWKRFRIYAEMIVWMAIIWQGGDIIRATIIYSSCPNFLYPTAVSHWPTFDSFLHDPAISLGMWSARFAGMGLAFYFAYLRWRTKTATEDLTTKEA